MYYVAYGSNLNIRQMRLRCPSAIIIGTSEIKDYRLVFRGQYGHDSYLTIEKAKGHVVPAGVWKISKQDEENLDAYEGYPGFYHKKTMVLPCSDGKRHRCMAYVMRDGMLLGCSSDYYMNVCKQGYDDFSLDTKYLLEAYEYSKGGKSNEE